MLIYGSFLFLFLPYSLSLIIIIIIIFSVSSNLGETIHFRHSVLDYRSSLGMGLLRY